MGKRDGWNELDSTPPTFPDDFGFAELNALRGLALFARGLAGNWGDIPDLTPTVTSNQMRKFAHDESNLGFRKKEDRDDRKDDNAKVKHVYKVVYAYLRGDEKRRLHWDSLSSLHTIAYAETRRPPKMRPGWELLDAHLTKSRKENFDTSSKQLPGVYLVHRYGTDGKEGGEIIKSAIKIDAVQLEKRIYFEAVYPSSTHEGTETILGNVESDPNNLFFLGYEVGFNRPYLMITNPPPASRSPDGSPSQVKELFGILLRRTTLGTVVTARTFVERVNIPWDQAKGQVDKIRTEKFKTDFPAVYKRMEPIIDNRIDGKNVFVLMPYARQARN